MDARRYAACLLPQAIGHELSYAIPDDLVGAVRPGMRVEVPLRNGRVIALVNAVSDRAPAGMEIKPLTRVLDDDPYFDAAGMKFLGWVSEYYLAPPGLVLRAAWPSSTRKIHKRKGRELAPPDDVEESSIPVPPPPAALTAAQQTALDAITGAVTGATSSPFLLRGVTGSGKSEVYLRACKEALDAGKSALVLVPEIALAIQLVAWFRARFGNQIVVLHSRLTQAERDRGLAEARRGPRIVIGARSAVFAPAFNLGLIVVDEEHESAFKQEDAMPHYHARDAALMRGKLSSCPVVLGSATPSLEVAAQARAGRITLLELPERIDGAPMPEVRLLRVDPKSGAISPKLATAIAETVGRGEQALLFLNRRGFSPVLLCVACGYRPRCPECSTSLVFHARDGRLVCHWCGHESPVPGKCPSCAGEAFRALGLGTQRVEAEVAELLPGATVVRMDLDTTRKRTAHRDLLTTFSTGDVLVGTQMIAKGLDFPRLTLVGVILADLSLSLPDFRAAEKTFQILTQVAGRAGRRKIRGTVLIQTLDPEAPAIRAAQAQDYWAMYDAEIAERKSLGYPPFTRIIRLRVTGPRRASVEGAAHALAEAATKSLPAGASVLGPAPAFPAVVARRHRWHLLLKGPALGPLRDAARSAMAAVGAMPGAKNLRLSADVEPVNVMS